MTLNAAMPSCHWSGEQPAPSFQPSIQMRVAGTNQSNQARAGSLPVLI